MIMIIVTKKIIYLNEQGNNDYDQQIDYAYSGLSNRQYNTDINHFRNEYFNHGCDE